MTAAARRRRCPECGGNGKVAGTVDGVPARVCTVYVPCETCWPRNADGTRKMWDSDGEAGWIPLLPWPPSAAHYHGFDRAVVLFVGREDGSAGYPVGMVDGVENHRAPRGLWDQRKREWYDWWTSDPEREGHSCRPVGWHALLAMAEVIHQAHVEGTELPSWVQS